jgi:hypothetical protein
MRLPIKYFGIINKKMTMKTIKNLLLLLLVVSVSSCDVGDDEVLNYGNGSYIAQFPFATKIAFFLKDDAVIYDYEVPVQVVGGNGLALTTDTTINYELDTAASTAILGTNFSFVDAGGVVTVPANSTFATIKLKVFSGTLDDQNPPKVVLKLTNADAGATAVATSGNKGSVAVTLQGTCESALAGSYSSVTTRITPAGGPYNAPLDVVSELSAGTYRSSFVGQYYIPGYIAPGTGAWAALDPSGTPGYTFKEVCGRVALESQNLGNIYSNQVLQTAAEFATSSVNTATGVITINYRITFASAPDGRPYRTVYTPL